MVEVTLEMIMMNELLAKQHNNIAYYCSIDNNNYCKVYHAICNLMLVRHESKLFFEVACRLYYAFVCTCYALLSVLAYYRLYREHACT